MKPLKFIVALLVLVLCTSVSLKSQEYCIRFIEVSKTATKYRTDIQMQADNSNFNLGSFNLFFSINIDGITAPTLIANGLGFPYLAGRIEFRPEVATASYNVEYISALGAGTTISASSWTTLATVEFDIVSQAETTGIALRPDFGTVVFLDNDVTRISEGGCSSSLDVALPVEFLTFTANPQSDNTSLLEWQTATELNNDFFQVEHSLDGIEFRGIGKVKGAGTTQERQDYTFVHRKPETGTNYYRLRQIDFDGTQSFSPVAAVYFDGDRGGLTRFKFFPNPADNFLMLVAPASKERPWQIDIFDLQGKRVHQFMISDQVHRLDVTDWPAGIYHINIRNHNTTEQYRFVKN